MSEHDRHRDDIAPYLLGALPASEKLALERHIEGCEECRRELEQLRVGVDALARSPEPLIPPPWLKRSLMRAARARSEARRRFALRTRVALAASAAALIAGIAIGYALSGSGSSGTSRVIAARVDRSRLPRASATLALGSEGAYLRVIGLPPPAAGHVYEAWIGRGRGVTPAGLMTSSSDGRAVVQLSGSLSRASAVMVTVEPAGGSRLPTTPPLIVAPL